MGFLTIEIILQKVRGNNVDCSTIEITSNKVRGNNVDFLTSKATSKKICEATWILQPANYIKKVRGNEMKIRQNFVFDILT